MNSTPIIGMFSGTGELARAVSMGLSVSAQRRLAGNAVIGLQARLMLQRVLTTSNDSKEVF